MTVKKKVRKGGGDMILVQKKLSPKKRYGFNLFSLDFESLWKSLRKHQKQKLILNVTYSPNNQMTFPLLEQLAIKIDKVITENEKTSSDWLL